MKKLLALVASATVSVTIIMAAPAHAVAILAVPGSFTAGFATPTAVATKSAPLEFGNADAAVHNVVAKTYGPDTNSWCAKFSYAQGRGPLFRSDDLNTGGYGEVLGISKLVAGRSYAFFCSYHAGTMNGTLMVQ